MKPPRPYLPALLVALAIGALPIACNVFVSFEQCRTDADCPSSYVCDPEARFCVDPRVDTGPLDSQEASSPDEEVDARSTLDTGTLDTGTLDTGTLDTGTLDTGTLDTGTLDTTDADADAGAADVEAGPPCDLTRPFASIDLVKGLDHLDITSARLTPDEKHITFSASNGCTAETCIDLFLAERADLKAPFGLASTLPGVNTTAASEYWPTMTSDGLLLFLESSRSLQKDAGEYVGDRSRIWSTTRPNRVAQFAEPYIQDIFLVPPLIYEGSPFLHPNGTSLYFTSTGRAGKGGTDIFVAQLGEFGAASSIKNLEAVNTTGSELMPLISLDDRVLYFSRETTIGRKVMMTKRSSPSSTFEPPVDVVELNIQNDWPSWLSDDQCRLYFVSTRPGPEDAGAATPPYRLWVAEHPK